ncbi:Thiamine-phosphate synthase [Sphingobacterium daejeonense]|nr:Thiamine-phosphate synthase [Sphingobacterium daejeonense]
MPIHPDFPYPLYLVISESDCKHLPWLQVAEAAIQGGVDIIQLREKDISRKEYLQKAIDLKNITDRYAVPLIINDAADIAAEIGSWVYMLVYQIRNHLILSPPMAIVLKLVGPWNLQNN